MELLYKKERKTATKKIVYSKHTLFLEQQIYTSQEHFIQTLFVMFVTLISSVMNLPAERVWVNKNLP